MAINIDGEIRIHCETHCLSSQFSKIGVSLSKSQLSPLCELEISTSEHLESLFCV